jgi:hypothetical protein
MHQRTANTNLYHQLTFFVPAGMEADQISRLSAKIPATTYMVYANTLATPGWFCLNESAVRVDQHGVCTFPSLLLSFEGLGGVDLDHGFECADLLADSIHPQAAAAYESDTELLALNGVVTGN